MQDQDRNPMQDGIRWDAPEKVAAFQPDRFHPERPIPTLCGTDITRQVQTLLQSSLPAGSEDFVYSLETMDPDILGYRRPRTDLFHYPFPDPTQYSSLSLTVSSLLLDGSALPISEETILSILAEQGFAAIQPYNLLVLAVPMEIPNLPMAACTIDQTLQPYGSCYSILSGGRVLSLFATEPGFPRMAAVLEELLLVLRHLFDPCCVLGISRIFDRFSHCHMACREAIDALQFSHGTGIRRYEDLLSVQPVERISAIDAEQELERLLCGTDREAVEQYLSTFLHGNLEDMDILHLLAAAHKVLTGALGVEETNLLLQRSGLDHPLQTEPDLLIWRIQDLCRMGFDLLARENLNGVGQLCRQVLNLIQQNYMDEDMSLLSVCEALHVSPNYLSANMKHYAGDTFINLLIQKRMEVALGLITSGNGKVGDIARRCGYRDQHYFSFCFKKYYGVSPLKMRQCGGIPGVQNKDEESP